MNRKLNYNIQLILVMIFFFGCAGQNKLKIGETRLVDTQGSAEYKSLSGDDVFIGVSKDFVDEASARDDASLHARKQIIQSLEMKLSTEIIDRYLVQGETGDIISGEVFQDAKTKAVAENILRVKPQGFYIEKWMRGTSSGIEYYYKVWTLIRYSRENHNEMVFDLVKFAEPFLKGGISYRQQGRIRDALRQFNRVKELLMELDVYKGISTELSMKMKNMLIELIIFGK